MKLYRYALAGLLSLAICFAAYGQTGPGTSPLSIPKGGTSAATASAARTALGVAVGSNIQAWDADLDAIAALSGTNTIYYRSAANTWTGVTIGGALSFTAGTLNVGDAELVALAGLISAANKVPYFTGSGTASLFDSTSYGRSLVNAADAAALRTLSASVIGTNVQAWDADLDALAAIAPANDDIIQRKAGAWTNRTIAQLATDLSLASTYQPLDSDLTSWALVTRASGYDTFAATPSSTNLRSLITDETGTGAAVFANSPALITPTGIVKGDVGLGNVDNTSDASKTSTLVGAIHTWALAQTFTVAPVFTDKPNSQLALGVREVLSANRTYYVRADGSDSNTGLVNSSGGAFLTSQKAINTTAAIDISTFNVTIQLVDSTGYTGEVVVTAPWVGSGNVTLQGNLTTPANVKVTVNSPVSLGAITVSGGGRLTVAGMELASTGSNGNLLNAQTGGIITIGAAMRFGSATGSHMRAIQYGSIIAPDAGSSYSIVGGALRHLGASPVGYINLVGVTVTLTGTPAFSDAFAFADRLGFITNSGVIYSGSATGTRYISNSNAVINTFGGGANFFPGNVAGSTATGGLYL